MSLTALWLPIVLSAVAVCVLSSVLHMVFRYHNGEYRQLPHEESLLKALDSTKPVPGFYAFPYAADMKAMGTPEMLAKYRRGPVGTMHLVANRPPAMGSALGLWFAYSLLVAFFAAYLASRTLAAGTDYLQVFRVVGVASFMAYSFAYIADAIWNMKPWSMALKHVFDGLLYGLVTAGVFGWLWPA